MARWYDGITRYQWLVLLIASLGWIFDVFEGQIFVASMRDAMPSLVPPATEPGTIQLYNNIALGAFLLGGALGGIVFGVMSDRIGRTRTMSLTILMYSLFTCLSAFSQQWWHLAGFRFLVAMGVGGEWAVASAMVAEVFPSRARAWSLGIFHASSVFGTYLAVAVGTFVIGNAYFHQLAVRHDLPSLPWRIGFAMGVLPAFLILWIRWSLREPESWQQARDSARGTDPRKKMGVITQLFTTEMLGRTCIGVLLAAVGMATFWGVTIYGKDVLRQHRERQLMAAEHLEPGAEEGVLESFHERHQQSLKRWEMLGMFLVTTGAGAGLVCFGPICERLGRRGAFLVYHLSAFAVSIAVFNVAFGTAVLMVALPLFGFVAVGMHAGYAIYFPELFPTRLRGTGAGFCFNCGRVLAAPILFISGWMQKDWGYTLAQSATILSGLFLIGLLALVRAPETKGQELPA